MKALQLTPFRPGTEGALPTSTRNEAGPPSAPTVARPQHLGTQAGGEMCPADSWQRCKVSSVKAGQPLPGMVPEQHL